MRCKFCGSKAIYSDKNHIHATAGRVITGAVIAGTVGAVAGLAGKNVKGYRCSACGMFSEEAMILAEEMGINAAIRSAKKGERGLYEQYQEKYANLEIVPLPYTLGEISNAINYNNSYDKNQIVDYEYKSIKRSYSPNQYIMGDPFYITNITIKNEKGTDVLLVDINNISGKTLRSLYFKAVVYDDAGDLINTNSFTFQGLSVTTGEKLPQDIPFNLNTNLAYKVDILFEKAAFFDDTVWRKAEEQTVCSVPDRTELTPEDFANYPYLRILLEKRNVIYKNKTLYYPVMESDLNLCICGNPVCKDSICLACGLSEADLEEVMDYDQLIQCRKDVIAQKARKRTDALRVLLQQAQEDKYQEAVRLQKQNTKSSCTAAMEILASIKGYKDADKLYKKCNEIKKDLILAEGKAKMTGNAVSNYEAAIDLFRSISGWKNADEMRKACRKKIEEIKAKEEEHKQQLELARLEEERIAKRNKKIAIIAGASAAVLIFVLALLTNASISRGKYNKALALEAEGNLIEAAFAYGAAGNYSNARERTMALREDITTLNSISAGGSHTVALRSDGTVVAVGRNKYYECEIDGWDWDDIIDIAAGSFHTVGLKADGTVVVAGDAEKQSRIKGWKNIVDISAYYDYTVGLKADGTVVFAGDTDYSGGEVGAWRNIIAIDMGGGYTVGLKADGTVVAVGDNRNGECNVDEWKNIVAIAAGQSHTVGLRSDGTVVAVGDNEDGQLNVKGWRNIVAIAAGEYHTVGLRSDGTVVSTEIDGAHYYYDLHGNRGSYSVDDGQCDVGNWRNIVAIAARDSYTVGLRADGTVVAVGENDHGQCNVDEWKNIKVPEKHNNE